MVLVIDSAGSTYLISHWALIWGWGYVTMRVIALGRVSGSEWGGRLHRPAIMNYSWILRGGAPSQPKLPLNPSYLSSDSQHRHPEHMLCDVGSISNSRFVGSRPYAVVSRVPVSLSDNGNGWYWQSITDMNPVVRHCSRCGFHIQFTLCWKRTLLCCF